MKLTKYIAIGGMLAMLACSEPVEVTPLTYTQILTGETKRAWSIRSVQMIQPGKSPLTFGLDDCVLDDLYVFYNNAERTFQVLEGATACNPGDPTVVGEANWSLVNATATLQMLMPLIDIQPYSLIPFVLKEINETRMVTDVYIDDKGTAYRFNFQIATVE